MGSKSDAGLMQECLDVLASLGIPYETAVMSAHRQPEKVRQFAQTARERGVQVIIAAAGLAAHLPGVVAAWTPLPVIGVPVPAGGRGRDDRPSPTSRWATWPRAACSSRWGTAPKRSRRATATWCRAACPTRPPPWSHR